MSDDKTTRILAFTKRYGWVVAEHRPRWNDYATVPGQYSIREDSVLATQPLPELPL